MSPSKHIWTGAAVVAALLCGSQLIPATAHADPETAPPTPSEQPVPDQQLHNVTYKARVDGVARGAQITYKFDDAQVNSADPTMLPGRVFEASAVLSDPQLAGMQVSIDWPYSANLHCEILVDDQTVAQADSFIAPRLTPARDDPGYGVLSCGAPLDGSGPGNVVNTAPADAAIPPAPDAPPA
ncbi:MAG: hypothetical protein JST91_13105 [Actinobacteria bacterium]|nr:hypothetical protein [Actinomycetota bacterium]